MKRSILTSLLCLCGLMISNQASALGVLTKTNLRCIYKTSTANTNVETDWIWALNTNQLVWTNYKISGNWFKDSLGPNMFFTNTSRSTLTDICKTTLSKKGISKPLVGIAAADNSISVNFTIWINDSTSQTAKINKVVAFGDSVSDTGNLYNATAWEVPTPHSYYFGHFTNGEVWVQRLASKLALPEYNWAVGGAGGDDYIVVPGVDSQVDSFLTYMQGAPSYRAANTLFTMLVGANDLIKYGRTVDAVISAETRALEKLIAAGAKNILMLKLPDLSRAPEFALRDDDDAARANIASLNARLVTLRNSLAAKYGSTLNIQLYDTKAKVDSIFASPSTYGITNTTQSCLELSSISSTNYATTHRLRSNCTNPDTFLFWDLLHPSAKSHQIIGDDVTTFVKAKFPLLY